MKGIFVTGTDTGVGKTYASLGLIAGWRKQGLKVGVMKPSETDCGEAGPQDAKKLLQAAGSDQPLEEVCPFQYDLPLAPGEAALAENKEEICFDRVLKLYRSISSQFDITLVEGAGGLLVPFAGEKTTADLIRALEIPMVIVARIGLGTINHTWLTMEAARARGLEVKGVIFSRALDPKEFPPGPDETRNPDALKKLAHIEVIANLPYSAGEPDLIQLSLS